MKKVLLAGLLLGICQISLTAQNVDIDAYRTIDGQFNNPDNADWGAAHTQLLRFSGNGFTDSISVPAGLTRPNPRVVSNALFAQEGIINDPMQLSDFTWVFGQFIDHDIGLTEGGSEPAHIPVPTGDPHFDPLGFGNVIIPMSRNDPMPGTGTSPENPREFPNAITAFIDGSAVYHSEQEAADWLRTFEGGKLKTSAGGLLPYNTVDGEFDSEIDPTAPPMADDVGFATRLFVAGDIRVNENPLLCSFHTLFVREHNRQCDLLAAANPDWTDEELYQYARKIVGGLIQSIVYNEWLPTMGVILDPYQGFDPTVNPQLSNVFTAAAFRVGHTLLNGNIRRTDASGNVLPEGNLDLRSAFFIPSVIPEVGGIEPYLRGMGQQNQQMMDARVIDDVRNFLFGPPGAGGLDLAAININRGRERGLPSFNRIRLAYGLSPYTFLEQINGDLEVYAPLFQLYDGDIRRVDPWVGMLAEEPMPGALFGETILRIMEVQFTALRDGDRFFYLNDPLLTDEEKAWITGTSFRDVIMYNTDIALMQDNVFLTTDFATVCENMTLDVDGGVLVQGSWDPLPDTRVDVLVSGESIANNITGGLGVYGFDELAACNTNILSPTRNDEWLNGITVQDLVIITRHILGLAEFESPYEYLAADVNFDENVSVTDIVTIRRLILDLDDQFDDGFPWRFVAAGHGFIDPNDPWIVPVPSTLNLPLLDPADYDQGFVAYKLGDVDASANLTVGGSFAPILAENTTAPTGLSLTYTDQEVAAGEQFELRLELEGKMPLEGYQLALDLGDDLEAWGSPRFEGSDEIFAGMSADGQLRMLSAAPVLSAQAIIIPLRARRDVQLSEVLALNEDFNNLALSDIDQQRSVELLRVTPLDAAPEIANIESYPNPFTAWVNLSFESPTLASGQVKIYDLAGRELLRQEVASGTQQVRLVTQDWPSGEYLYRYESALENYEGKLIK